MKRRNGDSVKLRRSFKRCKIDGMYGSALLYVKFLLVWALIMTLDFLLQFRFEYLWPVWLLLRSVSDSFRYQGLAFSVFFVCISITSNVICYLFIPVQLLFFAASTYVWIQYVWQTDRGFYPPTILLWIFFVYFESCVRLRDDYRPQPFHIDLCRPFAAHCIGYPVITLGFGVKSYVSYRLRLRKQKVVGKDNEYYQQLLQQALPAELEDSDKPEGSLSSRTNGEIISNGNGVKKGDLKKLPDDSDFMEQRLSGRGGDEGDEGNEEEEADSGSEDAACSKVAKVNGVSKDAKPPLPPADGLVQRKGKAAGAGRDDAISRLESDLRRARSDLQSCRTCEQELRSQISNLVIADKSMKSEVYQLQQDNDSLQTKLANSTASRQRDKQAVAVLEKKLQEERKLKAVVEQQLAVEKKARKADTVAVPKPPPPPPAQIKLECPESCRTRRKEADNDIKQLRRDLKTREDLYRQLESEVQTLRQYRDSKNEVEILRSRLVSMLSAETRHKLDLFSAYGDAKRQIDILQGYLAQKDAEVRELQLKMAEVTALLPATSLQSSMLACSSPFTSMSLEPAGGYSSRLPSQLAVAEPDIGLPSYSVAYGAPITSSLLLQSTLEPNAIQYQSTSCD